MFKIAGARSITTLLNQESKIKKRACACDVRELVGGWGESSRERQITTSPLDRYLRSDELLQRLYRHPVNSLTPLLPDSISGRRVKFQITVAIVEYKNTLCKLKEVVLGLRLTKTA